MLKEFEGIIDSQGLYLFRQPTNTRKSSAYLPAARPHVRFWAVLELPAAMSIFQELLLGRRIQALRLLEETAVSLGPLPEN